MDRSQGVSYCRELHLFHFILYLVFFWFRFLLRGWLDHASDMLYIASVRRGRCVGFRGRVEL